MGSQRFRAVIAADSKGRPGITVPFDPDQAWGAKADHPVGGTIDGRRVRGRALARAHQWVLPRPPHVRAARIAEVTDLLAAGVKELPRPRS